MFRITLLATISLLATAMAVQAADPILFGPYIQRVETEKATVMWITSDRKVSMTGGGETRTRDNYRTNSIRFDGLKPDTDYTYEIEGVKGTFRTAPAEPTNFRFVVYGDTRSNEDVHKSVVEAIRRQDDVSLVLNSGDLVSKGTILDHWKSFFRAAEPLMRETYYVPCLGNHEDNAKEYFDFFDLPGNEEHFSFNWGGIHFVALNTEGPSVPDGTDSMAESELWNSRLMWEYLAKQRAWLDKDLSQNYGADFFVLFFHIPFYDTKLTRRESQITVRKAFADVLEKHHVELVVTGHTHNYQHHKKGMSHYIVSGGGGASLYDIEDSLGVGVDDDVEIVAQEEVNNFLVIDMDGWRLRIKALRPDDSLIEEFSLESQAGMRMVNRRIDSIGGLPWEQDDEDEDDEDDDGDDDEDDEDVEYEIELVQ